MSRRINFLDTETTGLNEPDERIVEYCANIWDLDTREKIKVFNWRINPQRKIGAKAQKVHGISNADVENEPTYDQRAPLIKSTIEPMFMCVAHNGDHFDFPFIRREQQRVGQFTKFPLTFDTMTQARWATPYGKNPRLGELCMALDVPYDPSAAHAAEYDTDVMAAAFFKALDLGWFSIPKAAA